MMFEWFLEKMKKILNPCKNCLVQPLCTTGPYMIKIEKMRHCKLHQLYSKRISKMENIHNVITGVSFIAISFLIILYVVLTFLMGLLYQWNLIFS